MYEKIKQGIQEIIEIAKLCPKELQEKCFELLLKNLLDKYAPILKTHTGTEEKEESEKGEELPRDLNATMEAFLKQFGLKRKNLEAIFHISESGVRPLFSDLKVTKVAKKEIRLACLLGLKYAILEGDFRIPLEELREWAVDQNAYDAPNFMAHLKNNKKYFVKVKSGEDTHLSAEGKKEAASIIKDLSS